MVNIVTPPMSPEPVTEIWDNVDEEGFLDFNNANGTNLLSAFDMEAFAQELEEHPDRFEDEIDFEAEEDDEVEFGLEIPQLHRSDNMHEVHVIDPLDEDIMPLEPPPLIREDAMNFISFLTSVVQEYDPNSNNNPPANIITYYPDPLDLI